MDDFNEINNNLNNINISTPTSDKCIFEFNGELISIDSDTINIILNDIDVKFKKANFPSCKTEEEVLSNLFTIENECMNDIDTNFYKDKKLLNFLKHFVSEIIEEQYKCNNSFDSIKNKIETKLNDIINEIHNCEDINKFNLYEKFLTKFKTDAIPEFLKKNILDEIDTKKLINEFYENSEKEMIKFKKEISNKNIEDGNNLMVYYYGLINEELKPFKDGNKEIIFQILLYSNLIDIYKNPNIKELFLNNYSKITAIINYHDGIEEYEDAINNRKTIAYINEKLTSAFNKYTINQQHLFMIASFFYLVFNKSEYLSRVLYTKILRKILYNFSVYCPDETYTYEKYIFLFNYFCSSLRQNEKEQNINYELNIYDIEAIIKTSKYNSYINKFSEYKAKIEGKGVLNIFKNKLCHYIKLKPLTKKRNSHIITILISGFLSQKDELYTWRNFYNFDRENSNYYMFNWPASDVLSYVIKSFLFLYPSITSFTSCYNIAENAGRILALFLICNNEFKDCQINIVGYSMGCQVVVNCLKELNELKKHRFMVNNVLLMGGATIIEEDEYPLWRNIINNVVAGRLINCYSYSDKVLDKLFRTFMGKTPIGLKILNIRDEKGEYELVDNYNFTHIQLGHLEYRSNFDIILQTINFFNGI